LLLSIAFFALGQLLFVPTFKLFEPHIDGISFQIIEHDTLLKTSLLFSLLLAGIPVLVVLTWRLTHIVSTNRKIASALLILIFLLLGIFLRHQEVKIYFTTIVRPTIATSGKTSIIYPIDPVNFIYYMLAGLITGSIISFAFFKLKSNYKA